MSKGTEEAAMKGGPSSEAPGSTGSWEQLPESCLQAVS